MVALADRGFGSRPARVRGPRAVPHFSSPACGALAVEVVLHSLKGPTRDIYFSGSPGKNRVAGRTDLVFDDWLYPVFESLHLAEPRSSWLPVALSDGSVRFVVTSSDDPRIDGVNQSLRALGYIPRAEFASIYIWEQTRIRK